MKTSFLQLVKKQKEMMRLKQRKTLCATESAGAVDESKPPLPEKGIPGSLARKQIPASPDVRASQILGTNKKVDPSACRFRLGPRAPLGTTGIVGAIPSIRYLPNWISLQEEKTLMQSIYAEKNSWKQLSNRRLQVI